MNEWMIELTNIYIIESSYYLNYNLKNTSYYNELKLLQMITRWGLS